MPWGEPIIPESIGNLIALLFMMGFIIMAFCRCQNYLLAWVLATFLSPVIGLIFLVLAVSPLELYYLFGMQTAFLITGLVSAVVGIIKYLYIKLVNG